MTLNTKILWKKCLVSAIPLLKRYLLLIICFSFLGWTGSWYWFPELFSHFYLQYVLILIPITSLLLLGRDGYWRWLALKTLVVLCVTISPYWISADTEPVPADAARLRVLQYNAAGKTKQLAEWLSTHGKDFDIVLVLEAGEDFYQDMLPVDGGFTHSISKLSATPFSIALLSRLPLLNAQVLQPVGEDYPALQVDILLDGKVVRLIGIHPPPPVSPGLAELRNNTMSALAEQIKGDAGTGKETIVFGDFNSTIWSPHLREFMALTGLRDAQVRQGAPGTWPAITARYCGLFGIPIDMLLVSEGLAVDTRTIGQDLGSDHLPVRTYIALKTRKTTEAAKSVLTRPKNDIQPKKIS